MISTLVSENDQPHTPSRSPTQHSKVGRGLSSTATSSNQISNSPKKMSENSNKKRSINSFLVEDSRDPALSSSKIFESDQNRSKTDRFIPLRSSSKLHLAFSNLHDEVLMESKNRKKTFSKVLPDTDEEHQSSSLMRGYLRKEILGYSPVEDSLNSSSFVNQNLFKFQDPSPHQGSQRGIFNSLADCAGVKSYYQTSSDFTGTKSRKIAKGPFKVLDAPALQDDFYLNLLDWSASNLLAVGLNSCVYLWSAGSGKVFKVCDLGDQDLVTSVNWSRRGSHLAVGTNEGEVHIWDINKVKKVRTFEGHAGRVGTLAWGQNCLISGSRDQNILMRDVRQRSHYYDCLSAHKQEVCGLKWSTDDQLFASGGNDNKLFVWTPKSRQPIFKFSQHKAAVKALAWSPHQHGLLASGGGTADRCIRFWNAHQGKLVKTVDTGSQVCNLLFSKNVNELVSTHGYTKNQIHLWSYPHMNKIVTLTGHSYRVLYLAMSPDGKTIVTGAGDETLRFWNLFPGSSETNKVQKKKKVGGLTQSIMIR